MVISIIKKGGGFCQLKLINLLNLLHQVNLNHWFSKMTQRGLSKTALNYLGCKLLRVNPCIQQDLDKKTGKP